MGSGNTKHENTVADKVDKLHTMSHDFTVLRLHGDTGALIAGSLAILLLFYIIYRAVMWRRAKLVWDRREAEEGTCAVCIGPGSLARRAALCTPRTMTSAATVQGGTRSSRMSCRDTSSQLSGQLGYGH